MFFKSYCGSSTLLNELQYGGKGKQYSDELKSFACTLHFYSPRAYAYVRGVFGNHLPHSRTISRWYESADGEPGLTVESFAALKLRAQDYRKRTGKRLLVCLEMDEVHIRQQVQWNQLKKTYDGKVELGGFINTDSDEVPVAREALVFMVTSVSESWKIPIGYFLINGLNTDSKKSLIENVLINLHAIDVTAIAFTFDGTHTNVSCANALGAHLKFDDSAEFRNSFPHPSTGEAVYVLLDISHMIKLVRNALGSQEELRTRNGKVEWKYFEKLIQLQNSKGLKLVDKLTERHINYKDQKMKVLLAVQLLSLKTAKALDYLRSTNEDFLDCGETVRFITIFNNIFDVFNSKNIQASGFKKPMCRENFEEYKALFREVENYIKDLKLSSQKKILSSKVKTGFLGFILAIRSFTDIFEKFVLETQELDYIATYRFSQDHLESFFSAIRSRCGNNNNPNSVQFKAAYKRLLRNNSVTASVFANCTDFEDCCLLFFENKAQHLIDSINISGQINDSTVNYEESSKTQTEEYDEEYFAEAAKNYAARVQSRILKRIKCQPCFELMATINTTSQTTTNDIALICKLSDFEFKVLVNSAKFFNVQKYYASLVNKIFNRVTTEHHTVFSDFLQHILNDNEPMNNHRIIMIKLVIELFLDIRIKEYTASMTGSKPYLRNKLTKIVTFLGN